MGNRNRGVAGLALAMVLAVMTFLPGAVALEPATFEFTYQGHLTFGGTVVNGTREMKFRLYDAATGGSQVGPEITVPAVVVSEGKFSAKLNFGSSPFRGQARWLEISVSGSIGPPYVVLAPRQALTATPYAAYALYSGITASIDAQFSQDDRSGWTHTEVLGDDTCFLNIPLGFTFTGWGLSINSVSVSSNGLLFFGSGCSNSFNNTALPTGISNDPILAFFWDDLDDFGAGEYFEYATFGSPGGRVFNLYYRNRLHSPVCGADAINLMVSIHEGSNLIRVTYSGFSTCANMRGAGATIGLQGPGGAGADAFMVSYNAPILDDNAPRQSVSFQPPRQ